MSIITTCVTSANRFKLTRNSLRSIVIPARSSVVTNANSASVSGGLARLGSARLGSGASAGLFGGFNVTRTVRIVNKASRVLAELCPLFARSRPLTLEISCAEEAACMGVGVGRGRGGMGWGGLVCFSIDLSRCHMDRHHTMSQSVSQLRRLSMHVVLRPTV